MNSNFFIGIPCYEEKPILHETLRFLRERTVGAFQLEVNTARQSVVKNKNALLAKARLSNAEFICLCDDDIEPESGWDRGIVDAISDIEKKSGARVGQAAPLFTSQCLWINTDLAAEQFYEWIDYADPRHSGIPLECYRQTGFVGAVAGTLTVFHRDFLDAIHWEFDDRYERSQIEDIDQSLTCRAMGMQVLFVSSVSVLHHQDMQRHPRAHHTNVKHLVKKWRARNELTWPPSKISQYSQYSLEVFAWSEKYVRMRKRLSSSLAGKVTSRLVNAVHAIQRRVVR